MNVQQAKANVEALLPKQREELQALLIRGKDYLHVARKLKISATTVRNFDIITNGRYVVSEDGYGKVSIRKYIISRRYIDQEWPAMDDVVIENARKDYDKGKVEMVTGRDGFYQLLYRIPRTRIDKKRKAYFEGATDAAVS